MLAALIALAAAPGAAAVPDRSNMGADGQIAQGASKGQDRAFGRLAQAQGPGPDAASKEGTQQGPPPLKWLRYSSERFRTLMQMLAARSVRTEAKRAAEEAKLAAEAKAAEDAKRIAEAKAAEDARRVAEAKAAEDARRIAEAKAAEDAKRIAEAKAAEDAKRVAEVKAAEDARRIAEAKAAEDAKKTAEAAKPAPAKRLAPCRNAGAKVAGAGWYVVQIGDSLWSIARAHYGYGRAYGRIHAANRRTIANPGRIYPCQRIYIPRGRLGEAPLQDLRVALAPFIRRRPIDGALPDVGE